MIQYFPFPLIVILIIAIQFNCTFPIKKESSIRDNTSFIYLDGGRISITKLNDRTLDADHYKFFVRNINSLGFQDKNNYFVLAAKDGRIDIAEKGFLELMNERPSTIEPFLNLISMLFVLEEYNQAKEIIASWMEKNRFPLVDFIVIMNELEKNNRIEERGMYLEALSSNSGYELYSWKELGKYFLFRKDYDSAEYYLQKVLESVPFEEDALLSMLELCIDSKRWSEVIDYGKALNLTPGGNIKAYFFIGKGYYESQNYKKSIEWLEKAPNSEKNQLEFIILWRDALISDNPSNSLLPLRNHLKVLQMNGLILTEEEILPTLNPYGREIMNNFIR